MSQRAIEALGLTSEQFTDLRRMLPERKLEAIKRFREITGVNLAEAKAAVDAIEAGAVPGGGPPVTQRPAVSLSDAKTIADLAAVLPAPSRPPSREEAVELTDLVLRGAVDDAAARLGALYGLDPTTAADAARRLRSARRGPRLAFAVIALALLAAAAWIAWRAIAR